MPKKKKPHTEKVLDLFREKAESPTPARAREIEAELGLAGGHFRVWWSRRSFNFETLIRALRALDIKPEDFFAEVFRDDDSSGGTLAVPEPEEKRKRPNLEPTAETAAVPRWIEDLDQLRYHDAEAAIRALWSRVDDVEVATVARYLGVLGSAYRSIGNLPEARDCLHKAEAKAVDDVGFGDALQRLSALALHEGDLEEALGLSEQAAGVFARSELWVRFGEAHVDQANIYLQVGAAGLQHRCLDIATFYLKEAESATAPAARMRRTVFLMEQLRTLLYRRSGELYKALRYAQRTVRASPYPEAEGNALAVTGLILRDLNRNGEALKAFRKARRILRRDTYATLMATVDIVECLARLGQNRMAITEAETTAQLIGSLESSSPVREATWELWTQARQQRLAVSTLETVRRAVEAAKANNPAPGGSPGERAGRLRRIALESQATVASQTGIPLETLRKAEAGSCAASKHASSLERWMRQIRPENSLA